MNIANKVRSARAWLNWTQEDLVSRSGLSLAGIQTIERGESSPTMRTLKKLENAFGEANMFFLENGIEHRPYETKIFENFMEVLEDAFETLEDGQEIIMHCADESRSSDDVKQMLQKMRSKGIIIRMTLCDGDEIITGEKDFYRWIDRELFANSQVEVIYDDKFLFHLHETGRDIFVMAQNKEKARTAKRQFEYQWKKGKTWAEIQTT